MNKKYIYFIIVLLLSSVCVYAQMSKLDDIKNEFEIEGFNLFPNPVNTGKIYISSSKNLDKNVEIFDVLGKIVLQTILSTKELDVSNIPSGVYIIKVKEKNLSVTRKLIIK